MAEPRNLGDLFAHGRNRAGIVAWRGGEPCTLGMLECEVRAWKAAFLRAPGQRMLLHSADALEFVAALLGAWHAGKHVLVPSDLQVTSIGQLGIGFDGKAGVEGGITADHAAPAEELSPLDPESCMLEMLTSGSTGRPVPIPKCLRQVEHEVAALAAALGEDWGPLSRRVVGTVSHQHMYGLVFRLLLPLSWGRPFEATRLALQDLASYEAVGGCNLVASPAQLASLPERPMRGCRVHSVLCGGGLLEDAAIVACRRVFDAPVVEMYGSSESGAVTTRRRVPGRVVHWRPLPGVQYRVTDGVLELRTRQLPTDEWFWTADRVVSHEDGFELAGRVDRIVKVAAKRVSLDTVEQVLLESGLLRRARALLLDGPRRELGVVAQPDAHGWQLAAPGKRELVERLRTHLRESARVEVLPRRWRFVDPWPVTIDGKTPLALLLARFDRRNPEFRVVTQSGHVCILEMWVSPTAPFFAGHFPAQPILAGVVQVEWLVWLCREVLGIDRGFGGLEAAKFRRAILPGCRLTVALRHDPASQRTRYEIRHGEQACATGRIRWADG